ncbi:MAG: lysostaphin resistance A-like protein [Bryobacteraceae bacterium]
MSQTLEREPEWGYRDLFFFAGIALPCMLLAFMSVQGLFALMGWPSSRKALVLVPGELIGYSLAFAGLRLYFSGHIEQSLGSALRWTAEGVPVLATALNGVSLAVAVVAMGALLQTPDTDMPIKELLGDPLSFAVVAVAGVTLGPFFEELIFRGLLQPVLVRSLGAAGGIVAVSAIFGVLHLPQYGMSWRHGVLITLAGVAFGWCRHRRGSTLASTLMHCAYNLTLFALFAAAGKGIR